MRTIYYTHSCVKLTDLSVDIPRKFSNPAKNPAGESVYDNVYNNVYLVGSVCSSA